MFTCLPLGSVGAVPRDAGAEPRWPKARRPRQESCPRPIRRLTGVRWKFPRCSAAFYSYFRTNFWSWSLFRTFFGCCCWCCCQRLTRCRVTWEMRPNNHCALRRLNMTTTTTTLEHPFQKTRSFTFISHTHTHSLSLPLSRVWQRERKRVCVWACVTLTTKCEEVALTRTCNDRRSLASATGKTSLIVTRVGMSFERATLHFVLNRLLSFERRSDFQIGNDIADFWRKCRTCSLKNF